MGRQYKIYVDMSTRNIYDANAAQLNDNTSPYIYYKENIQLRLQYLNAPPVAPIVDGDLDKYTGLAGLTIANSAAINNTSNHYDKGALNVGKSGTVTSIVVKNLEAAPRLKSGTMLLINSAGESESIAFTNYSVTSSIYTFTVSATLTYTYLTDDMVRVKETPIIKSEDADIDDTDKDTGLFLINLDGYTQTFQELAEGKDSISSCKFEHQIVDDTGKLIFALKFPFLCFGLLDDAGTIPPAPDDDYYTKTQVDALLAAKQDSITASGILKGDGAGNISAASSGTDYAAPATTLAGYGITDGVLSSSISVDTGLADDSDSLIPSQHAVKYYVDNNAGVSAFTGLSDTPSAYTGEAGKYVKVNAGETALEFGTPSGSGDMTAAVYDPATIAEQLVGLTATQTLTNKTLTAPVISSISNTGTLTLPTDTDTLTGRATTDTLTNKTIDADNNTITNIGSSEIKSEIITGLSEKASPVSADKIMLSDSEASGALKYLQISNLPSGSGSTSDTSWTGTNWTSTTSSPSQRAVQELANNVGVETLATNLSSSDHQKIVTAYNSGGYADAAIETYSSYLKAYWALASTADSVGSHTLTNTGTVSFANDGKNGKDATFSGSNYLSAAASTDFQFSTADWCLSAWIYPTSTASGNFVLCCSNTNNTGFLCFVENTNLKVYLGNGSSWSTNTATGAITQNAWNHIVMYRESGTFKTRVNDSEVISVSASGTYDDTDAPLTIGRWDYTSEYFTGQVDEVALWKGTALDATARTALYNSGTGKFYGTAQKYTMSDKKTSDIPQANLLVNGTFAVWQAGTSSSAITTTRTYLADQWAVKTGAGTLTTVARSSTVPTGSRSKYSLELTGATGVTTVTVDQRIEALNVPKGTVYFSAQVYNGSGAAFTPKLYVSTPGSSDVWTTPTVINGSGSGESLQSCADSAWTKIYWTADISAYSNIANGVEFKIEIPSGSLVASDTVRVADVVLTYGNTYIAPLAKNYREIYADCLRYYWIQTSIQSFGGYGYYAASAGQAMGIIVQLPVPMRVAPTVTLIGTWIVSNCAQPTASNPTTTSVSLTAAATAAGRCAFYNGADTGLSFDARL